MFLQMSKVFSKGSRWDQICLLLLFGLFSSSKIWILINLFDHLSCLGFGLKCQVCNGTRGLCFGRNDNGISKECLKDLNACYYVPGGKQLFKNQ